MVWLQASTCSTWVSPQFDSEVGNILGCLFARSVQDKSFRCERRRGLDVECIKPVPTLAQEIQSDSVELEQAVDERCNVASVASELGQSSDG